MNLVRFSRRAVPAPLCLVALLLLSGCFTYDTLVTLRPDGSGTLVEVFKMSGAMLEFMTMFGGEDAEMPDFCDEDELMQQASTMGAGVTLLDATPLDDDDGVGCRATFAFEDINSLQIDQDPGKRMPDAMNDAEEDDAEPDTPVTFSYTPGSPLTINVPQNFTNNDEEEVDDTPPDSTEQAMQMNMMREMFKGAYLRLALVAESGIAETNATYADGNMVTLMEIDFDTLLEDEETILMLNKARPQSGEEVQELIEDVDGIWIETQPVVTITMD